MEQIDAPLIAAFLEDMQTRRGICAGSRNLRLTAIRSFFRYASSEMPTHAAQIQRVLAIPNKRCTRAQIGFLAREETDALLRAPDLSTRSGRRDHALILLAVQTGLRLSEFTGLCRRNVCLTRRVEQISASLFGNGENGIDTMKTELSSLSECNSFGSVPISNVGILSFTTQRYNDTRAPLAIQCWMDHGEGYSDPYGKITHGCPPQCEVTIESDEVIVKTNFENETLRDPLLASGYFADTGKRIPSGYLSLEVWKMQPSFAQAFRQQNARNTH